MCVRGSRAAIDGCLSLCRSVVINDTLIRTRPSEIWAVARQFFSSCRECATLCLCPCLGRALSSKTPLRSKLFFKSSSICTNRTEPSVIETLTLSLFPATALYPSTAAMMLACFPRTLWRPRRLLPFAHHGHDHDHRWMSQADLSSDTPITDRCGLPYCHKIYAKYTKWL